MSLYATLATSESQQEIVLGKLDIHFSIIRTCQPMWQVYGTLNSIVFSDDGLPIGTLLPDLDLRLPVYHGRDHSQFTHDSNQFSHW